MVSDPTLWEQLTLFRDTLWSAVVFSVLIWFFSETSSRRIQKYMAQSGRLTGGSSLPFSSLTPSSLYEAYELGRIGHALERTDAALTDRRQVLILEAYRILNLDCTLAEEFGVAEELTTGLREQLRASAQKKSRMASGVQSVSRLVYYLSLLGIGLAFIPAIVFIWWEIPKPLQSFLVSMFQALEPLCAPFLFAVPLYIFCHANTKRHVQLAALLAIFPFVYGLKRTNEVQSRCVEASFWLHALWFASYLLPMAYCCQSSLLGFCAIGAIFASLGFGVIVLPSGWAFGFWTHSAMHRCFLSSLILQAIFLALKSYRPRSTMFQTFSTGSAVFGPICTGLTGLILTWDEGVVYPAISLALAGLGRFLAYQSLANTSIVFVGLWLSAHWLMIVKSQPLLVFLTCVALFWGSSKMDIDPQWVFSILGTNLETTVEKDTVNID